MSGTGGGEAAPGRPGWPACMVTGRSLMGSAPACFSPSVPHLCLVPRPLQVFDPDKIVFLNDVLFCANDVLRLALHQADLACGLDLVFNYWAGGLMFYDFWRVAGLCAALMMSLSSMRPGGQTGMPLCQWRATLLASRMTLLPRHCVQGDEGRGGRPRQGQAPVPQPPALCRAHQAGPAPAGAVSRRRRRVLAPSSCGVACTHGACAGTNGPRDAGVAAGAGDCCPTSCLHAAAAGTDWQPSTPSLSSRASRSGGRKARLPVTSWHLVRLAGGHGLWGTVKRRMNQCSGPLLPTRALSCTWQVAPGGGVRRVRVLASVRRSVEAGLPGRGGGPLSEGGVHCRGG